MALELNQALLGRIAGWNAVKEAKGLVQAGRVQTSDWNPPLLRGTVQGGDGLLHCGLRIADPVNVDNLCSCRQSRRDGSICAHSVAVGLHWLKIGIAQESTSPVKIPQAEIERTGGAETKKGSGCRVRLASSAGEGEEAELHLIFPPGMEVALSKGRIAVAIELETSAWRRPLNTVSPDSILRFSSTDAAVFTELVSLAQGELPALLVLNENQFAGLLVTLIGHPNLTLGKRAPLRVKAESPKLGLQVALLPSGSLRVGLQKPLTAGRLIRGKQHWLLQEGVIWQLPGFETCPDFLAGAIEIRREWVPDFLIQALPVLRNAWEVEMGFSEEAMEYGTVPPVFRLALAGGLARLDAQLTCAYGQIGLAPGETDASVGRWLPDPSNPLRYALRNLDEERRALARLAHAGFVQVGGAGLLRLTGEDSVLQYFARHHPRLSREWEVSMEERLERSTSNKLDRIEPAFQVSASGERWLELDVGYVTMGGEKIDPLEMQRLLRSGRSHARLKNGKIGLLDTEAFEDFQEVLRDCEPQQTGGTYRIAQQYAPFLQGSIQEQAWTRLQAAPGWVPQRGDSRKFSPQLGSLEPVLRDYQKEGVSWLGFLRHHGFGGVLADEMGLGKTIQTLAFLRAIKSAPRCGERMRDEERQTDRPSLVVCPTSLVSNWLSEAARFTPELRSVALVGTDRAALFPRLSEYDLVVTSYALLRRDAEYYRDCQFDLLVLDEAQHIKNRQSQNAQSAKSLRANQRLVLTGTPMENSVLDLWSVFDFLMPGYLGAARDFRDRYEIPISRDGDRSTQNRLTRKVRPFVLRRLKRDVAKELPPRIEKSVLCDLTPEQVQVYQQVLQAGREEVETSVSQKGLGGSRMVVLTTLLRLRQVCCDLRLLSLPGKEGGSPSGKMLVFEELLEEIQDGGHRVLVFSQFVSMLTILRQRLSELQVPLCYLDGSTVDRAAEVARFQKDPDIPAFLISLKAGGTGLNLTGADTVVHFDPWWNPAVESQATDRAHRIGQSRVVTSYKLIARGTVEEKIVRLQEKKKKVLAQVLGEEAGFSEALDWEEIQELLRD